MGASVLLGESLVLTKSFGHPGHQSGGLEGADEGGCTGAGQVVGRREGSAIRQPGLGRNDRGLPAATSPGHASDASWLATKLVPNGLAVVLGEFFKHGHLIDGRGSGRTASPRE